MDKGATFKKITVEDRATIERFVKISGENNCETAYINMLVWQGIYGVSYCASDDTLLIKSSYEGEDVFALPFGDFAKGMAKVLEYTGGKLPVFRAQEGPRLDRFVRLMGAKYDVVEQSEGVDYVYRKEDLACLVGKKYHAKRNHIAAFSRSFEWRYEPIDKGNVADVGKCADRWYAERADSLPPELNVERKGVEALLAHFDTLGLLGGAVRVGGEIVAFCLASYLNDEVVDVHVEKALAAYEGAYAVVNNRFAKSLAPEIQYINREDDMGLEGLRKAKLSYHPTTLLKKYACIPIDCTDEVRNIYTQAFGASPFFDALFFHTYRDNVRTLAVNGKIVSILFLLPCAMDGRDCYYLYAAATEERERGKGYMSRLIREVLTSCDAPVFLVPASADLIPFYARLGFYLAKGVAAGGDVSIAVSDEHKRLAAMCADCPNTFPLMWSQDPSEKSFTFPYIMQ